MSDKNVSLSIFKMHKFRSLSCCLLLYTVMNDSVIDIKVPDQTVQMYRLMLAFIVCICLDNFSLDMVHFM